VDVAACLPEPRPHIVFCTAFDQYAVDAFELHAVDYLLKPISRARLVQALARVRGLDAVEATGAASGEALDRTSRSRRGGPARFLVRNSSVFPLPGGSGEVLLKNGQRLEVSRRRFRDLLQSI
jgi:two-component system, LytTR family, response regulator